MGDIVQKRRGRPRSANRTDARERILAASCAVFGELGYDSATLEEIAQRAELTRPAVNHYFGTKRGLYDQTLAAAQAEVMAAASAAASGHGPLLHRLTAFVTALSLGDYQFEGATNFLAVAILDSGRHPELRDADPAPREQLRAHLATELGSAVAAGELPADTHVDALTETVLAVMLGVSLYAGFVGDLADRQHVIDSLPRLLSGVLAQAPGPTVCR